jgi:hypothetical protein
MLLCAFTRGAGGGLPRQNRAGQEVARRSLQRRHSTGDCQTACSFLARAQLRRYRVSLTPEP